MRKKPSDEWKKENDEEVDKEVWMGGWLLLLIRNPYNKYIIKNKNKSFLGGQGQNTESVLRRSAGAVVWC